MYGQFVTAKLRSDTDTRQGWIVSMYPLKIMGEHGYTYICEGEPTIVENPPPKSEDYIKYLEHQLERVRATISLCKETVGESMDKLKDAAPIKSAALRDIYRCVK